jgi:general secretion pathway protein H
MKRFGYNAGFTLIEVLVVIFIISIVTSVALLSLSRNENRQLESFANEFAQIMTLAEEQAMLQPSVLGLSFNDHSFQFSVYQSAVEGEEKKHAWAPLQDNLLGSHVIPNSIQLSVKLDGKSAPSSGEEENTMNVPQIIISTNGDVTPFTIYVSKKGQKPRYAIRGEADGNITSKSLS